MYMYLFLLHIFWSLVGWLADWLASWSVAWLTARLANWWGSGWLLSFDFAVNIHITLFQLNLDKMEICTLHSSLCSYRRRGRCYNSKTFPLSLLGHGGHAIIFAQLTSFSNLHLHFERVTGYNFSRITRRGLQFLRIDLRWIRLWFIQYNIICLLYVTY